MAVPMQFPITGISRPTQRFLILVLLVAATKPGTAQEPTHQPDSQAVTHAPEGVTIESPQSDVAPCCQTECPRLCGSLPCDCFAPDFIYHPPRKFFRDKYTRIQECQSKMIMRPGDEFWWVSSRHLPLHPCDVSLCVYRYENCQAKKSSVEELKAAHRANPELYNFIYIHENRADLNKAELRFWQTYNILINQAPNAPPVRYIFFSWPADQIRGQIRDVKEKAIVSDHHAYYLAWFLCEIRDFNRPSLSGYSYGCRLGVDALFLAGGGSMNGRALPEEMLITQPTFRAAFVATAMQNRCLPDGGFCEPGYQTLDRCVFLNNSNDKVLKHFHLLDENGADAIGRAGVCDPSQLSDGGQRLIEIDTTCVTGRSHKLEDYLKSECIRQTIRDTIFWRDLSSLQGD